MSIDTDNEKRLADLEKKINQTYAKAYVEAKDRSDRYFERFKDRYAKEYEAYMDGKYTEAEFKAWVETQIARGKRYEKYADDMANIMTHSNEKAAQIINGELPYAYVLNANHEAYRIAEGYEGISFELYDEATVQRMLDGENHTDFKRRTRKVSVDPAKDYEWNTDQIHKALTSGILQGKGPKELADSFYDVMKRNRNAAMRNARTAYTSAQNGGRQDTYDRAHQMGIDVEKEWIATLDKRTRDSHQKMDGERVPYDELFSNRLEYPADPRGDGSEVYNCRCTIRAVIKGENDAQRHTYGQWKVDHKGGKP